MNSPPPLNLEKYLRNIAGWAYSNSTKDKVAIADTALFVERVRNQFYCLLLECQKEFYPQGANFRVVICLPHSSANTKALTPGTARRAALMAEG